MEAMLFATNQKKVRSKCRAKKEKAADGKLHFSDAELVQNFSTSAAMPLSDHRDRRRGWDAVES